MAWLEKRGDSFHLCFRLGNEKFKKSLKTTEQDEADATLSRVERRLKLIEDGDLTIPDNADLMIFLISDGKLQQPVAVSTLTLHELLAQYKASLRPGTMEANSISTIKLHLSHIERHVDSQLRVDSFKFQQLQDYADNRSLEKGQKGRPVSPVTIKKELASLSGAWNWGLRRGLVKGVFSSRGLTFQKTFEKPRFQTRKEIEQQIAKGKLSEIEKSDLWECLYLTEADINDVLRQVKKFALHDFIYPMVLMAAHTGARRSEIVRSQKNDFDLAGGFVSLHEKKRVRGKTTIRTVPLSAEFKKVMCEWLKGREYGQAFSNGDKTLSVQDATHHLDWTLKGTKWECIRGWHIFRHSFISICASRGVDQRMIDDWSGHQTEEMRKRYRHLLPNAQQAALNSVF